MEHNVYYILLKMRKFFVPSLSHFWQTSLFCQQGLCISPRHLTHLTASVTHSRALSLSSHHNPARYQARRGRTTKLRPCSQGAYSLNKAEPSVYETESQRRQS